MEMVERVASAIADGLGRELDVERIARAAIAAMREPTDAMVLAGVHHDNMGDMAGRWQAMIAAALNPTTEDRA